jgi:hypothetical protein
MLLFATDCPWPRAPLRRVNVRDCFSAVCRRSWIDLDLGVRARLRWEWLTNCGFFCRIDYHLATPALAATAKAEKIYLAQRFSDHAPLIIDYGFAL